MTTDPFKRMTSDLTTLYRDRCTITVQQTPDVGLTGFDDFTETKIICENQPCKISKNQRKQGGVPDGAFLNEQFDATLFLAPSIVVPTGAIVDVTDVNGQITRYRRATKGYSSYVSHVEVALVYDERS